MSWRALGLFKECSLKFIGHRTGRKVCPGGEEKQHWESAHVFSFENACLGWDLFVSIHRVLQKQQRFILKPCSEQMLFFSVSIPSMKKSNTSTSVCSRVVHSLPKSSRFKSEYFVFPIFFLSLSLVPLMPALFFLHCQSWPCRPLSRAQGNQFLLGLMSFG